MLDVKVYVRERELNVTKELYNDIDNNNIEELLKTDIYRKLPQP